MRTGGFGRKPQELVRLLRSPRDAWLAVRMIGWALLLPALKRAVALPTLARFMWRDGRRPSGDRSYADVERIVRLAGLAARFRPLPHGDNCLERSLIAYRYLSAANAEPHLVVAVRKEEEGVHGHVWVALGGEPVPLEDVSTFTPVLELGRRGGRVGV